MTKCQFCGSEVLPGTGTLFVTKEGTPLLFCGSKCEKHRFKLGRRGIRTRWTKKFKKSVVKKDDSADTDSA